MATKPDKITIEPGKYATVVRLHHGAESDLWRKGPYKRERAFASPQTAIEHARRAFPGVPIVEPNRRRLRRNSLAVGTRMDAQQFCEAVKAMADTNGKWLSCHSGGMGSHSQVFIDFINLPIERVREKRGGGAEGSNNRMLFVVAGFARELGQAPPTGKVKLDTRISLYGAPDGLSKLRGKSGTPEAIAKYVSAFISKVAAEVPGKFTHANRRRRTSRRNPPPLYRGVGIDSAGRKHSLGTGPLAAMKSSTMAQWLGDRDLKSAYVLDARGNSYLSLEPRDRARLSANGRARRRSKKRTSRRSR